MRDTRRHPLVWSILLIAGSLAIGAPKAFAQSGCNQAAPDAVTFVPVPGHPFTPIPTSDGCWIFVSVGNGNSNAAGVAVLQRAGGRAAVVRVIPTHGAPAGMVLTHDGRVLIGALDDRLVFLDTAHMISGQGAAVLGYLREPEYHGLLAEREVKTPGAVYVNVTSDDRFVFVSDEWAQRITVIDLEKARSSAYRAGSIVGTIPTGSLPIAVTLSPDNRYLYTTVESAANEWAGPPSASRRARIRRKQRRSFRRGPWWWWMWLGLGQIPRTP